MNKAEFLTALRERLPGLSPEDISERIAFYSEAIDDRIEDGLSEENAVAQLGTVDDIAARILNEVSPAPELQPTKSQRKISTLVLILLILGAPIWISLMAAAISVVFSFYAVIWSIVASIWAVGVSLAASALGCFALMVLLLISGNVLAGLTILAVALFCTGLSIFAFMGSCPVTKGAAWVTKHMTLWIIGLFKRKDSAK